MRALLAALLAFGLQALPSPAQTADEILAQVRASLPREPLLLEAELTVRQPGGVALRTLLAEMRLHWGAEPPQATYALHDRFGEPLETMRITWDREGEPLFERQEGSDAPEAIPFDPSQRIGGLDIAWSDLGFSFLWWTGGQVLEPARIRSRPCHVLDLPAPAGETHYGRARLWVDQEALAVLEAEIFDRENQRVRRLVVKSIQKLDEVWTLRDLDVFSYPSRHRTSLRVLRMERLDAPPEPAEPDSDTL